MFKQCRQGLPSDAQNILAWITRKSIDHMGSHCSHVRKIRTVSDNGQKVKLFSSLRLFSFLSLSILDTNCTVKMDRVMNSIRTVDHNLVFRIVNIIVGCFMVIGGVCTILTGGSYSGRKSSIYHLSGN